MNYFGVSAPNQTLCIEMETNFLATAPCNAHTHTHRQTIIHWQPVSQSSLNDIFIIIFAVVIVVVRL